MEEGELSDQLPSNSLRTSSSKMKGLSLTNIEKLSNEDWDKIYKKASRERRKRTMKRLFGSSEGTPASPNRSPLSKVTTTLECEVTTAVESITPDNSDTKVKTKPTLPDKEAVNSHLRVAIVNEHNFLGQISAKTAAYIKAQLSAALRLAVRDGVFVPTFKTWTYTDEILRITCTDIGALDWLSKAVEKIPETVDAKFQVIQEDRIPKLTKISLFVPDAKVEEMNEVKKMLALQNCNVKVNSWRVYHKESKDDGLLIVAGTVDEDVAAIEAQGGSIFYEFSTVKVTIHSPEYACPSTSAAETNHTCKKALDCLSSAELLKIAKQQRKRLQFLLAKK